MKNTTTKTVLAVLALAVSTGPALAQTTATPDASARMFELGAENGQLAGRVGSWTVTETIWDTPGAAPRVIRGLIAERRMVGSILQETLRDPKDPKGAVLRLDYLSFNRVEGRFEYVSMDARAPVGIMTAQSVGPAPDGRIAVIFQPFALAGGGKDVSGQMLRMRQDVILAAPDRDTKDQYFTLADGTATEWLAHRYDYVRR